MRDQAGAPARPASSWIAKVPLKSSISFLAAAWASSGKSLESRMPA
jgi:hypothetical protein